MPTVPAMRLAKTRSGILSPLKSAAASPSGRVGERQIPPGGQSLSTVHALAGSEPPVQVALIPGTGERRQVPPPEQLALVAHDTPFSVPPEQSPPVRRTVVGWQVPPGQSTDDTHDLPALLPPRQTSPMSPPTAPGKNCRASLPVLETTMSSRRSPLKSATTAWDAPKLACSEKRLSSPPVVSLTRTRTSPSAEPPPELLFTTTRSLLREQTAPTFEVCWTPHCAPAGTRKRLSSGVPQIPSIPAAVSGSCPGLGLN